MPLGKGHADLPRPASSLLTKPHILMLHHRVQQNFHRLCLKQICSHLSSKQPQSQTDSQTDSESCSSLIEDSTSELRLNSSSEAMPKPPRCHWLHQCRLTSQQLQHSRQQLQHPLSNCISSRQLTASQPQPQLPCQNQASSSGHHNDQNSIQNCPDHLYCHDEAVSEDSRRMSHDDFRSTDCADLRTLSAHHPVTLSPVWLPVGSLQQQDQQQPNAKRPRLIDKQQQQQQQQLPVPPLRFFIQSPHEFASVYLPGRASAKDCE